MLFKYGSIDSKPILKVVIIFAASINLIKILHIFNL